MTVVVSSIVGFLTSFVGSMCAFILWVHYDLDDRWEMRKYNRAADKLMNQERKMREDHEATLRDFHDDGYAS